MQFRNQACLVSFSFASSIFLCTGALARPLSPECAEGLAILGRRLSSKHEVIIANVANSDIPPFYETPFSRQGQIVTIAFQGQSSSDKTSRKARNANALISSPQIQLSFAKSIMQACSEVDIVQYALTGTDDSWPHFRMPSGSVEIGVPLSCPGRLMAAADQIKWGFYEGCNSGQT